MGSAGIAVVVAIAIGIAFSMIGNGSTLIAPHDTLVDMDQRAQWQATGLAVLAGSFGYDRMGRLGFLSFFICCFGWMFLFDLKTHQSIFY